MKNKREPNGNFSYPLGNIIGIAISQGINKVKVRFQMQLPSISAYHDPNK